MLIDFILLNTFLVWQVNASHCDLPVTFYCYDRFVKVVLLLKNTCFQFYLDQFNLVIHITEILILISYYVHYWLVEYWSSRFFHSCADCFTKLLCPNFDCTRSKLQRYKKQGFPINVFNQSERRAGHNWWDEIESWSFCLFRVSISFAVQYSTEWGQKQGSQLLCFGL